MILNLQLFLGKNDEKEFRLAFGRKGHKNDEQLKLEKHIGNLERVVSEKVKQLDTLSAAVLVLSDRYATLASTAEALDANCQSRHPTAKEAMETFDKMEMIGDNRFGSDNKNEDGALDL